MINFLPPANAPLEVPFREAMSGVMDSAFLWGLNSMGKRAEARRLLIVFHVN